MFSTLSTILLVIQVTALITTIVITITSVLRANQAKGSETNG
ncbi:hypothetical protein [Gottfriedia acidiceleris]